MPKLPPGDPGGQPVIGGLQDALRFARYTAPARIQYEWARLGSQPLSSQELHGQEPIGSQELPEVVSTTRPISIGQNPKGVSTARPISVGQQHEVVSTARANQHWSTA